MATGLKPTVNIDTMSYIDPKTQQLSPEQHPYRMDQAQYLLQQLQRLLIEGENVGPEVITDTLQKTEGLLSELSQQKKY